ncbi:hypothetical protein B296_00053070, partial [Ensete ventricosum]
VTLCRMIIPRNSNLEGLLSVDVDPVNLQDIKWLKSITKLPIMVKGIVTAEDAARKAVDAGVSGIVVSNHGARQLDYTPPTISVLDEVLLSFSSS